MTPADAREAGRRAAAHLEATPEFRSAAQVALYAALPDELPSRPAFEAVRRSGKVCLLPRVVAGARLELAAVACWEDLRPGRHGVLEPPAGREPVALGRGDLAILPGVAFDRAGHRLGRGGGHYDRTLAGAPPGAPHRFGMAFALQVVEDVPCGPGDQGVDAIVTEEGVVRVARGGVAGGPSPGPLSGPAGRSRG